MYSWSQQKHYFWFDPDALISISLLVTVLYNEEQFNSAPGLESVFISSKGCPTPFNYQMINNNTGNRAFAINLNPINEDRIIIGLNALPAGAIVTIQVKELPTICSKLCLNNGTCFDGNCICNYGWTGDDCSQIDTNYYESLNIESVVGVISNQKFHSFHLNVDSTDNHLEIKLTSEGATANQLVKAYIGFNKAVNVYKDDADYILVANNQPIKICRSFAKGDWFITVATTSSITKDFTLTIDYVEDTKPLVEINSEKSTITQIKQLNIDNYTLCSSTTAFNVILNQCSGLFNLNISLGDKQFNDHGKNKSLNITFEQNYFELSQPLNVSVSNLFNESSSYFLYSYTHDQPPIELYLSNSTFNVSDVTTDDADYVVEISWYPALRKLDQTSQDVKYDIYVWYANVSQSFNQTNVNIWTPCGIVQYFTHIVKSQEETKAKVVVKSGLYSSITIIATVDSDLRTAVSYNIVEVHLPEGLSIGVILLIVLAVVIIFAFIFAIIVLLVRKYQQSKFEAF
eukprot:TRINITY_DN79_c3_g5_i1.p1 TRINITY_DN79_c3_g5~~TRINITY_DN79_c3_g5_i1.p1  ORF type:complete len:515 (-),score=172.42 TRINITY_DN79_c3_g5_i1:112-1656(-)